VGTFITLFFLSSHLRFTYKSWYFGLAHKQHEAALNALIFPAYCKPDFSPASIILKGTAYVKPHQKVWSPYKCILISYKSLHSSPCVVFGSRCFSQSLMTKLGQRYCPLCHILPYGGHSGKQEETELLPLRRKEPSRACVELLIFIHTVENQSRTEVMTNCLHAALSSDDQCTNAWFLRRNFFQEQTLFGAIKVFAWCVCADLSEVADRDTSFCPDSRGSSGRHSVIAPINLNYHWCQFVMTQGHKMGWVQPISYLCWCLAAELELPQVLIPAMMS